MKKIWLSIGLVAALVAGNLGIYLFNTHAKPHVPTVTERVEQVLPRIVEKNPTTKKLDRYCASVKDWADKYGKDQILVQAKAHQYSKRQFRELGKCMEKF